MRTTGPYSQYNRAIARHTRDARLVDPTAPELEKSLLGLFGAGEARFITSFVEWADADGTSYGQFCERSASAATAQ